MLAFAAWMSRHVPALAQIGDRIGRISAKVGLRDEGARGPFGLILVSFAVSPTTGRAAAATAGHGFLPGWALAITGDMAYFVLLMVSTLWLSNVLGSDDRLTVGVVLGATWGLPLIIRWARRRAANGPSAVPSPQVPLTSHEPRLAAMGSQSRRRAKRARKR